MVNNLTKEEEFEMGIFDLQCSTRYLMDRMDSGHKLTTSERSSINATILKLEEILTGK
jgi:hypothetical protein